MEFKLTTSIALICTLLTFASLVVFVIILLLVGVQSRLKAIEHRIIFILILNFILYALIDWCIFVRELLGYQFIYLYMVSWFGFGSYIFLYTYYSIYPKQITQKHSYLNALLLLPIIEYLAYIPQNLYVWGYLTSDSSWVKLFSYFNQNISPYSFPYAVLFMFGAVFLMIYEQFFKRFRLMHQIPSRWLVGMLILPLVLVLCYSFSHISPLLFITYYFMLLIFSIYVMLFLFYCPQTFSSKRSTFNNHLKEIFVSKTPTLLLDKNQLIIHVNEPLLKILNYKKTQLIGQPIQHLLSSFPEGITEENQHIELDLIAKPNVLLSATCKVEKVSPYHPSAPNFQAVQLLNYSEVGKKVSTEDQQLLAQLKQLMEEAQLFLNPQLQQTDVADVLEVSKRKLGELMSTHLNSSFPAFVNAYRVKYAQAQLKTGSNSQSLEEVGRLSGFSSKTSFYTIFKEFTGQTPGQYRKTVTS